MKYFVTVIFRESPRNETQVKNSLGENYWKIMCKINVSTISRNYNNYSQLTFTRFAVRMRKRMKTS